MRKNLIKDEELEWSTVVANNRMNRGRQAVGVNSYEQDIGLNPIDYIKERKEKDEFQWLDICCGEGNALIQTAEVLKNSGEKIRLLGIDLVDYFADIPLNIQEEVKFQKLSVRKWIPQRTYDLITIVHGLHYVGDKFELIRKSILALKKDGLFIANLDLSNIRIKDVLKPEIRLKKYFKGENFEYDSRRKILKIAGARIAKVEYKYIGADPTAGANYTGQEAVNSLYEKSNEKESQID